jgi:hypothetical protein
MLFNTLEWIKANEIELKTEEQYETFKKVVEVINENRSNDYLELQEDYDFEDLKVNSTEWQLTGDFTIYQYKGQMPILVKLDEIDDYVFYRYNVDDFAINDNTIYINEKEDSKKILQKVAFDDDNDFSFEDLWQLFGENSRDTELAEKDAEIARLKSQLAQEGNTEPVTDTADKNKKNNFKDEVEEFIRTELENTEWSKYIPDLKNILELSISHSKEKQKLFNLIAKIKLAKQVNIDFDAAEKDYNQLVNENEKYFVHSARGAFAYIHPNEILQMKNEGYKMALDFGAKSPIKIYKTAEEILLLNTNLILTYQYEKEQLFAFCEANKDANKHLLVVDRSNSQKKQNEILKLLNPEDDYQ